MSVLLWTIAASASAQSSLQIYGFLSLREIYVKSQPGWAQGHWGRFDVGAATSNDHKFVNVDVGQLGIDWTPTTWLLLHGDGVARKEQSGTVGKRVGLVQAFADLHTEKLRLRAGAFWLPTSRENVDPLWNSRYTITYSALNTWIGQEVRPVGIDLQYSPNFYITAGATAFRGNDTMGTALAARGWTFGNRLSVYDEVIAAIPDETRPIGPEIDHRLGYSERIRVQLPERALLQITHIDNRAELLHRHPPDVPWDTHFTVVGAELGSSNPTTLIGEFAWGSTALGFPGGSFMMDFGTAYLMLTQKSKTDRWSVRFDRFWTRNHERPIPDFSREDGHAWTVSWMRDYSKSVRTALEYVRVNGDRIAAKDPKTGGSTITMEIRYKF